MHWRRKWQPTPVFLAGESQGRGAWWAAVYAVAQNRTWLTRLSSSSSSSLSNGWVIIPQIWQMMGEEIFSLLWLSEALHIIFQDKEYVIISLSLVLIPYPSQEFSWLHLWKPKSLFVQKVDSLMQEKIKRQGVVYAVHWKKKCPSSCILWYSEKTELGILNDGNKGVRKIQEPVRYK